MSHICVKSIVSGVTEGNSDTPVDILNPSLAFIRVKWHVKVIENDQN